MPTWTKFVAIALFGGGPHAVNAWDFDGRYFVTALFVGTVLMALWGFLDAAIGGIDAVERKLYRTRDL